MNDVAIGQVWRDNDPRMTRRVFRVVSITEAYAICRAGKRGQGRGTRIRLDRFRETWINGYTLVG